MSITTDHAADISGFILERTAKRMKRYAQQQLAAAGADITLDQWLILSELDRQDRQNQFQLAQATCKDAPTVTRIIDLLCKKGLTHRLTDPDDRRRFQVTLTPAGRRKIAEVLPIIRATRRRAWHGLSDAEMDQLVGMLNRIHGNLE